MATSLNNLAGVDPDGKVSILLVDDQPAKLLSYEAILESLGENLVLASSGREALERLLKQEFAVILVDVCMPEQDGFELVEMIRAHHRFKQTAIIFVSAIQMTDLDQLKGYASGAVDYVSVPIVPEILRAKVAVFVDLFRKTRQLEAFNAELEQRVLERTLRLSETEVELREVNQRKDVFLATLAHELRNPLAPIRSSLDLFRALVTEEIDASGALQVMDRQLDQMTRLIDDLMDLSRINQGKLELRRSKAEIEAVIMGAVETAQPAFDSMRQELVVSCDPASFAVEVDPVRISQMISNLLLNASKYASEGGAVRLVVKHDAPNLVVRISDDGAGIPKEEIARVFEPFYQVDVTDGKFKSGLGIGLTLVRTIAEMHGGSVAVASDGPGKGSEFTVTVPCSVCYQSAAEKSEAPRLGYSPKRILIVDDNRDAADVLALLLSRQKNQVQVAYDGLEALDLANQHRPELIVMDLGMPGVDGFETASRIRELQWAKDTVLVAVTGWGQPEDVQKTKAAGFDHHFVKPLPFAHIETLLFELDRRNQPISGS